jgi:hypothetical protein
MVYERLDMTNSHNKKAVELSPGWGDFVTNSAVQSEKVWLSSFQPVPNSNHVQERSVLFRATSTPAIVRFFYQGDGCRFDVSLALFDPRIAVPAFVETFILPESRRFSDCTLAPRSSDATHSQMHVFIAATFP